MLYVIVLVAGNCRIYYYYYYYYLHYNKERESERERYSLMTTNHHNKG